MKIAWLGPVGNEGGVPTMGTILLQGLLKEGVKVDFYTPDNVGGANHLSSHPNLHVITAPTWWRWNKWYSRGSSFAFLSSMYARLQVHRRLSEMLRERHAEQPYDCIFQFSQTELFKLGQRVNELPSITIFPCVHAAGELRWHRRESAYARQSEGSLMHFAVRAILIYRSRVQRRDLHKAALVLGLSKRFNELLAQDYGIPPERLTVLYHPIGSTGTPLNSSGDESRPPKPMKLLYVSRISVRKGVEQIVELSKRLDDLHGEVEIEVIGGASQWSDYMGHLEDLNPRIARLVGGVHHVDMQSIYDTADVLLLPSMYEPGGIVVGEALSRGLSLVVSDEVGSAESIDPACCTRFPAGDMDAFELSTRRAIAERHADRVRLRRLAASEAERCFAPAKASRELVAALERTCHQTTTPTQMPSLIETF